MFKDWKEFWIYYQMYKKGKQKMEKAKEFINKYKYQIAIGTGIIFCYRVGYKHGYWAGLKAVDHFIEKATKSIEITKL